MRSVHIVALPVAALLAAAPLAAQDSARAVAGGGITVQGWTGRIDANEVQVRSFG